MDLGDRRSGGRGEAEGGEKRREGRLHLGYMRKENIENIKD